MSSFVFQTTRSIVNGLGSASRAGELVKGLIATNATATGNAVNNAVLVVSDHGVMSAGIGKPLLSSFEEHGMDVSIFKDTVADPPDHQVLAATQAARDQGATAIVGFGGGSSMDIAKLVAYLAHPANHQNKPSSEMSLDAMYGVDMLRGPRLPLLQVPTTAGTGSEVTPISIVTTGEQEKKGVVSSVLLPDVALLDGRLTLTVPAHVTAATGIDAMVHAVEAYTSRLRKNGLSDVLALDALRLLSANIEAAFADGTDEQARANMLLGSMYAGMAFANSPVAAVHALAYPIGARFHVAHGLSNSLMLPHVLRFTGEDVAAKALYDQLLPVIFPNAPPGANLADEFGALAVKLKLPTTLREVGIQGSDVQDLVTDAMKQTRLLPNNMRAVEAADAHNMYTAAL